MKILLAVATTVVLALGVSQAQTSKDEVRLATAQSATFGTYVADGSGRALYMFTADRQGTDSAPPQTNCYDRCAVAWPPLVAESTPALGDQLQKSLLGSITRKDGKRQVTYGGWPLSYYVKDKGAGSTAGQDVHGSGGEWYLVGPDGKKIDTEK
jgi:predicted lipoprotein with Yx(FWY)xxD motif